MTSRMCDRFFGTVFAGTPSVLNVTIVAIRRSQDGRGRLLIPRPDEPLQADDILVMVAAPGAVTSFLERV